MQNHAKLLAKPRDQVIDVKGATGLHVSFEIENHRQYL